MVKYTNLPTCTLTRIACTFFALLFGVLLISAFTLVNCAMAQDNSVDWPYSGKTYTWNYIHTPEGSDEPDDIRKFQVNNKNENVFKIIGFGNWTSSFKVNKTGGSGSFTILAAHKEVDPETGETVVTWVNDSYNLPSSVAWNSTTLYIHPQPNLAFTFDDCEINVKDLYLAADSQEENYYDYSNGSFITFDKCYSETLNFNISLTNSNNTITYAGNDLKVNEINLISGNVIFDTATTFDAFDSDLESITLTSQSDTDVKITTQGTLTFNAPLTISNENNAALKICCESQGLISAESVFISSGRVDIKGTLIASLEIGESAIFSPGNSVGKTTVGTTDNKEDFTINDNALLLMEIGGTGEDANDYLVVNGDIYMLGSDPTIELVLADGNSLGLGETFTAVLTSDNIYSDLDKQPVEDILKYVKTSDFTDLEYKEVGGKHVITGRRFTASEVPEPSTWALLVLGASGLLYWRKKNA